jgi:hypothetical protein
VFPTLLELAGLPVPSDVRGLALGPYLRERRPLPERAVICDGGEELAAYRENSFVRAVELASAWTPGAAIDPGWGAYRWDGANAYAQLDDEASERSLVLRDFADLDRYLRHPIHMRAAEEPSAVEAERLRALGYLEDEPAEPAEGKTPEVAPVASENAGSPDPIPGRTRPRGAALP